ncbi:hypothetical protein pb186bvf_011883 [Paramecium bursaria]
MIKIQYLNKIIKAAFWLLHIIRSQLLKKCETRAIYITSDLIIKLSIIYKLTILYDCVAKTDDRICESLQPHEKHFFNSF